MKKLFFLFALLSTPAWATQYYVDNCVTVGSDSNNGTSTSTPWLTLAHAAANSTTSDHVSLQGGCNFLRQTYAVPAGGVSGTPYILDSYGTGQAVVNAEPAGIFTATAEVGNTSEWSSVTSSGTSTFTATTPSLYHGSYGFDSYSDGTHFAYGVTSLTAESTLWLRYYVFIPSSYSQPATFDYTYISSLNNSGTILQHCYIQEQGSVGLYQIHCQLNYGSFTNIGSGNLTAGWHRVDLEYVAGTGTAGEQFWLDGTSLGSIFTQTSTTQINQLWLGNISNNAPTSGSHLYFDNVKVATTSTVAANDAITINDLNYVTLNNLNLGYSGDVGVYIYGGSNHVNITNSTIANVDANTYNAAVFQNGASNVTISGNTISNAEDGIAVSGYGSVANTGTTITANSMTNFGRHGIQVANAGGTNPTNVTATDNDIGYFALWVNDSVGLMFAGGGTGFVGSYNRSHNGGSLVTEGEDYDADISSSGVIFTYNQGWGSNNGCFILTGTGHFIYGNSCYNNNSTGGSADGELSFYSSTTDTTVENNIFQCGSGQIVLNAQSGATTGHTINYNDWYCATTTPFTWGGTAYSFSGYKTASSQDANSITGNPLYTSTVTPTLTLQATSPAIGKGTNLGSTYKSGLSPSSTWPSGVVTLNQTVPWTIGAYVYNVGGINPFWYAIP